MNAAHLAKTAYAAPDQPTRTLRGTEYEVFARITHRLKAASALGDAGFTSLARAIHDNRRLWTLLAADVADPGNQLPAPLRAQIFYLAQFTNLHSSKVLASKATAEVLVDINTSIMKGLRENGGEP
ncbi:flagellar biosynthesis regulator FlaF [Frigidibacter sp.]|uniref:flagellar biosynthesis regulator FlaF n=1 Tax=Frigidibacter sp. TaxID=2586418 RepID=UPI002735F399|nr:flagellar biosynthesis regulator FlaF [Frigidibacter sp.]MDP3341308.1 flagellar biosynthesis regulator FlaF [Frigidibacter sp.]